MKNWVQDIKNLSDRFGVRKAVEGFDQEKLNAFLEFRIRFLEEELDETKAAAAEKDAEEICDGLIDLCVVAIGTLEAFGVDAHKAWDEVHAANMSKEVGVNSSRENDFGLPDLIKPTMESHGRDWVNPSHEGNHGQLKDL